MTSTEELIELSKRVAEKLGIDAFEYISDNAGYKRWLYEDSARCFDLMCEHEMSVNVGHIVAMAHVAKKGSPLGSIKDVVCSERIEHHNGDKSLTARVAILRAIEGM